MDWMDAVEYLVCYIVIPALNDTSKVRLSICPLYDTYILIEYNIRLQYADDLPLVDVGQPGKPSYIPVESCAIEHSEPHLGKLGPKETSDMLKVAS
jgi:hypothetical protein